jgi:hypothetical protein
MSGVCKGTGRTARWFAVAALVGLPSLAIAGEPFFTLKTTVTITGNPLVSFDISWVDPELHSYLLADRSNKAIDVINTFSLAQSKLAAGQFAGVNSSEPHYSCPPNSCNGPNGVLSFHNRESGKHEVWAGDGPTPACTGRQTPPFTTACSTVKVIDFATGAVLHNIPTGGQFRADELCYDPVNHLIQVANDSELPFPYINYIPTEGPNAYTVVKQIQFDGGGPGHGPAATNGIEQCQWNRRNGMIYLNVPEVSGDGNDDVPGWTVIIDPRRMEIVDHFVIPIDQCAGPQGMAIGPAPEIMLGCNAKGPPEVPAGCNASTNCTGSGPQNTVVIDERNGNVIKTLANQGGNDEVWFNPGNGLYFLAEGQNATQEQLGIVSSFPFIKLVQDIIIAAPPGAGHAHSVAADPITKEVFMPIPNNVGGSQNPCPTPSSGCVAIYWSQY